MQTLSDEHPLTANPRFEGTAEKLRFSVPGRLRRRAAPQAERWASFMALVDDGDLIHGLGYVALYVAYLEEAVAECLNVGAHDAERSDRMYRWPTSQKIEYI